MKNKFIFITILTLFFAFSLQQTYAQRVEPNNDYYEVPKTHKVLSYTVDLLVRWDEEIRGQGMFDPAFEILKKQGYEIEDIFDTLNTGRFIEFKEAWEKDSGGIVLFSTHGYKKSERFPAMIQIGLFDDWAKLERFIEQLKQLGFGEDEYSIQEKHYLSYSERTEERKDGAVGFKKCDSKKVDVVHLHKNGIERLSKIKDLVIWDVCYGDETAGSVSANIVLFYKGTNFGFSSKILIKSLFAYMSGDQGVNSFTKAFNLMVNSNPDIHINLPKNHDLYKTYLRKYMEGYDYRGPDNATDLALGAYIANLKEERQDIVWVDDSSADIHFATKMVTRDFTVGERPVYVQAGTANCPSAQVDYSPDLKPRWIDEQTLRVTMNWGQCSVFPRWAKIIVRASYFQAKDNPHFYLNGRTYVEEGLKEHDGDGCRGYRSLGEPPYTMVDDDWFWIVAYNEPNGKSGEILNDLRPH